MKPCTAILPNDASAKHSMSGCYKVLYRAADSVLFILMHLITLAL